MGSVALEEVRWSGGLFVGSGSVDLVVACWRVEVGAGGPLD